MSKLKTSIFVIIIVAVLAGLVWGYIAYIQNRYVSWNHAKDLLANCQVKQISQGTGKKVSFILKDSSTAWANQPQKNDAFNLAGKAFSKCGAVFEINQVK